MFARVPRANHMCTFQGMTERTELSSVIRIHRRSENMKKITKLANKYYTAGVQGMWRKALVQNDVISLYITVVSLPYRLREQYKILSR